MGSSTTSGTGSTPASRPWIWRTKSIRDSSSATPRKATRTRGVSAAKAKISFSWAAPSERETSTVRVMSSPLNAVAPGPRSPLVACHPPPTVRPGRRAMFQHTGSVATGGQSCPRSRQAETAGRPSRRRSCCCRPRTSPAARAPSWGLASSQAGALRGLDPRLDRPRLIAQRPQGLVAARVGGYRERGQAQREHEAPCPTRAHRPAR